MVARELLELREGIEFLDQRFASEIGNGLVTVEPDVFQLVLGHRLLLLRVFDDTARLCADCNLHPDFCPDLRQPPTIAIGMPHFQRYVQPS